MIFLPETIEAVWDICYHPNTETHPQVRFYMQTFLLQTTPIKIWNMLMVGQGLGKFP